MYQDMVIVNSQHFKNGRLIFLFEKKNNIYSLYDAYVYCVKFSSIQKDDYSVMIGVQCFDTYEEAKACFAKRAKSFNPSLIIE